MRGGLRAVWLQGRLPRVNPRAVGHPSYRDWPLAKAEERAWRDYEARRLYDLGYPVIQIARDLGITRESAEMAVWPEKYEARKLAQTLPMPEWCDDCGERPPQQRHHHDYSKPLDVAFLCKPCHRARHRANDPKPTPWQRKHKRLLIRLTRAGWSGNLADFYSAEDELRAHLSLLEPKQVVGRDREHPSEGG